MLALILEFACVVWTRDLRAHRRIFRALLRKWNVTSGNWRHHIMSWQENPLTSKSHCTNCCLHRRCFLGLPRACSQINCACVTELTSGLRKRQNIAKHWFFQIISFEKVMGISAVSFISLKRTFFKIKRKPCLAGCKNEYKLSNHRLNTQIA